MCKSYEKVKPSERNKVKVLPRTIIFCSPVQLFECKSICNLTLANVFRRVWLNLEYQFGVKFESFDNSMYAQVNQLKMMYSCRNKNRTWRDSLKLEQKFYERYRIKLSRERLTSFAVYGWYSFFTESLPSQSWILCVYVNDRKKLELRSYIYSKQNPSNCWIQFEFEYQRKNTIEVELNKKNERTLFRLLM